MVIALVRMNNLTCLYKLTQKRNNMKPLIDQKGRSIDFVFIEYGPKYELPYAIACEIKTTHRCAQSRWI